MAYGYLATMRATPGNRDEVVHILLGGADGLRDAGCLLYVVSVDDTDADLIHVTEAWQSKQHHDDSLRLPETKAAITKAMPLLTGEFTGREVTVVGGLGVA
ncbi:putative quinol monooxygenase [Nucisporomicrobium flavum]|uniref:putative quinol monooxygenase n=1 Tax=Nucisporomicrobium flavum TaxID=2785915 RepID=UPI0018F74E98|nr:putative quinol monooxygenase [Nucisporomicrobium flavum]